jgi:dolichyl-phosphate-mannose--protein O-mannosyl transferase
MLLMRQCGACSFMASIGIGKGRWSVQYKLLLLSVLILGSLIVALVAGILRVVGGGRITGAVQGGAVAFAATMTLGLLVVKWLGSM